MLRITIEMIPGGVGTPRHMGTIEIANEGAQQPTEDLFSDPTDRGNYKVRLSKFKSPKDTWMRGVVRNFDRKNRGPFDLLMQALAGTVGGRNLAVLKLLKEDDPRSCEDLNL
ncbi:MAG: hypothetical protein RSD49_01680 [Hafnia sp.]